MDQHCFGQGLNRKPACPMPKCAMKHAKWLHKLMTKDVSTWFSAMGPRPIATIEPISLTGGRGGRDKLRQKWI